MTEKYVKNLKEKNIQLKEVKKYIPYSERIESSNDDKKQNSILNKDKDDMNDLYKMFNETRIEIMSYPDVNNSLLLLKSLFNHDLVAKDLFEVLFDENKHVDGKLAQNGWNFLNNGVKALAINESEKRFSLKNFFGKKR